MHQKKQNKNNKKNSTAKQLFCAFWLYQNWTTLLLHTSHILVTPFRNDCLSLGSLLKWAVAHKKGNTALWEKMQTQTIGNNWPVYPNATTLRNMGQSKWIFRKEKKRSMEQTESHEKKHTTSYCVTLPLIHFRFSTRLHASSCKRTTAQLTHPTHVWVLLLRCGNA